METFFIKIVSAVYLVSMGAIKKTNWNVVSSASKRLDVSLFRFRDCNSGKAFYTFIENHTYMGFWQEFRSFAMKGNVIDLAVGVIIGGAFGKIVTAMVDDVIMPLVAAVTRSDMNVGDKFIVLSPGKGDGAYTSLEQAKAAGANVFAYGHFIQTVVDFLIIAFFIFIAIRTINKIKAREVADTAPLGPSSTDKLLMEIRDLLKKDK